MNFVSRIKSHLFNINRFWEGQKRTCLAALCIWRNTGWFYLLLVRGLLLFLVIEESYLLDWISIVFCFYL